MPSETVDEVITEIRRRAIKIKTSNDAPDSYYHVPGDEPVDFVLNDELDSWADRLKAALQRERETYTQDPQTRWEEECWREYVRKRDDLVP